MVINDEHIDMAILYLKTIDEYICHYTVDQAISKIAKGDITHEKIRLQQEIEQKKKLRHDLLEEQKQREKEKKEIKKLMNKYLSIKKQRDGEEVSE